MTEDERIESIIVAYRRREGNYRRLGEAVERMLNDLLRAAGIPVSSVTHRLKDTESLRRKLRSSDKYQTLTDITDIVGARVITYFSDDVDPVANIIRGVDNFAIDLTNSIDKRRELRPDQFGYQSLHLVAMLSKQRIFNENRNLQGLKIEIQVRSLLQHAWAEIEHAYYRSERSLPPMIARRVSLVAGLLEVGDNEFVAIRRDAAEIAQSLPICRAEGMTELIPDFWLDLPRQMVDKESALILSVNTNITNRPLAHDETEVELYIEDQFSPPIKGKFTGVNALEFAPIRPPSSPKKDSVRFRVSGLRVNAFQLGVTSSLAPTAVYAALTVRHLDQGASTERTGSSLAIAQVLPSLGFGVLNSESAGQLPLRVSTLESNKEIVLTVSLEPKFPGAFRNAIGERSATEISAVQGTRVALWLRGVPEGARVFLTVRELPNDPDGSVRFQLTKSDLAGVSPLAPVEGTDVRTFGAHSVRIAEIGTDHVKGFAASHIATWECISRVPPDEVLLFGLIIFVPSDAKCTAVLAHALFSPQSTVTVGLRSSGAPVPRFGPSGAPVQVLEVV